MAEKAPSVKNVRSADGTLIAYERSGAGPPIILVGGALTSALRSFPTFVDLGRVLSSTFTVYTYDRRGRGDSGDNLPYAVDREIDDLEALIVEAGGAAGVHGLSSGGVLALAARVRGAAITKLVLFEPPLPVGEADPDSAAERNELIAAGRRGDVVERFVRDSVGLSPEAIAGLRQSPEWPRLEAVAHTLAYDEAITEDRALWTERARSVRVPTLVLDSDASPEHLRAAARAAAEALPTARQRTIAGSVHDAPAEILAAVLSEFFAA
jgi:pimeloyl-ACP methyl ester carboxylesterase